MLLLMSSEFTDYIKIISVVHMKDMWIALERAEINCTSYQYDSTFPYLTICEGFLFVCWFVLFTFVYREGKLIQWCLMIMLFSVPLFPFTLTIYI